MPVQIEVVAYEDNLVCLQALYPWQKLKLGMNTFPANAQLEAATDNLLEKLNDQIFGIGRRAAGHKNLVSYRGRKYVVSAYHRPPSADRENRTARTHDHIVLGLVPKNLEVTVKNLAVMYEITLSKRGRRKIVPGSGDKDFVRDMLSLEKRCSELSILEALKLAVDPMGRSD